MMEKEKTKRVEGWKVLLFAFSSLIFTFCAGAAESIGSVEYWDSYDETMYQSVADDPR